MTEIPAAFAKTLAGAKVIVFDGECILCSGFYRFVCRRDRNRVFTFATAQSPFGQSLYAALDLPLQDFETNLVVSDGRVHTHLDSVAAVMQELPAPWPVLSAVRWIPERIKRPLYNFIARNRFRWLGRYDTCLIPDEAARARFIDGGYGGKRSTL